MIFVWYGPTSAKIFFREEEKEYSPSVEEGVGAESCYFGDRDLGLEL